MSVDGLRCILYARIYIPYMHTVLYYYVYVTALPLRHYSAYQNSIYRHVNYLQQVIILTKLHVFYYITVGLIRFRHVKIDRILNY